MTADVTRPHDLDGVSLRELLDAWHRHTGALVDARHGLGDPQPATRLAGHALDALAVGESVASRLTNTRWATVVDALTYGATLDHAAAAMGLERDEVATGLRSWADGQLRERLMAPAQHDDVLALLAQGGAQ